MAKIKIIIREKSDTNYVYRTVYTMQTVDKFLVLRERRPRHLKYEKWEFLNSYVEMSDSVYSEIANETGKWHRCDQYGKGPK